MVTEVDLWCDGLETLGFHQLDKSNSRTSLDTIARLRHRGDKETWAFKMPPTLGIGKMSELDFQSPGGSGASRQRPVQLADQARRKRRG
jgi:hypothetical protein